MNEVTTVKAAVVGASGYSGEELVRLLLAHPHVELTAVTSRQYAGRSLADVFPRFGSRSSLVFSEPNTTALEEAAEGNCTLLYVDTELVKLINPFVLIRNVV